MSGPIYQSTTQDAHAFVGPFQQNTPIMVTTSNGVGIGTRTPIEKLHVAGSVAVEGQLYFPNRPLGVGVETLNVTKGTATLDPNIPTSLVQIDNTSNYWYALDQGTTSDIVHLEVATDLVGNVITAATSDSDESIYTSPSKVILKNQHSEGSSIIATSVQPTGEPNWQRAIKGPYGMQNRGITTDGSNAIFAGIVRGPLNVYDGNTLVSSIPTDDSINIWHTYICKFTSNGDVLWSAMTDTQQNGEYTKTFGAVANKTNGDIYIVGSTRMSGDTWTLVHSDGSNATLPLPIYAVNPASYVLKLDTNGVAQWINLIQSSAEDMAFAVDVTSTGDIVTSIGATSQPVGTVTIYSQDTSNVVLPTTSMPIAKYDTNGNVQWVAGVECTVGYAFGNFEVKCDANDDVYICGQYTGSQFSVLEADGTDSTVYTLPSEDNSGYFLKFSSAGSLLWAVTLTASFSLGNNTELAPRSITVDSANNVYLSLIQYQAGQVYINVKNADGSLVTLPPSVVPDQGTSRVLKFDSNGNFIKEVFRIEGTYSPHIRGITYDHSHDTIYAAGYVGYQATVYDSTSNVIYTRDQYDGYKMASVFAFDPDGVARTAKASIYLPRQYNMGFKKDIVVMTSNEAPLDYALLLERANGTYALVDNTLMYSNASMLKSYSWNSNEWVSSDQLYITKQGLNSSSFYYGDQSFTQAGTGYVGARITWDKSTMDNKLAFRVTAKTSLASDEEIAYRQFEALVSPVADEETDRPQGITYAEVGDLHNTGFSNMMQSIERYNNNSVDLKVLWDTSSSNYIGNIEVHVLSSTRLGNISFKPLHN